MSGHATGRGRHVAVLAATLLLGAGAAGCGGGDGDATTATIRTLGTPDAAAVTPRRLAADFESVTGLRVDLRPSAAGTKLLLSPGGPDRRPQLGTFDLTYTCDDALKRELLGDAPQDGDGLSWRRFGSEWQVGAAFGPCLVATSPKAERAVDGRWRRLQRALEATVAGG